MQVCQSHFSQGLVANGHALLKCCASTGGGMKMHRSDHVSTFGLNLTPDLSSHARFPIGCELFAIGLLAVASLGGEGGGGLPRVT